MKQLFNRLNWFDTIFNRLIISFVGIVVIVVLSVSGFLTVQFSINYNQKAEKLERYRLEHLKSLIDDSLFEEPNRMIMEITSLGNKDKEIQKFLHYPMKNDYYKATELDNYLQVINAQNVPDILNIEVYVLINDIWVSTQSGISYTNEDTDAFLKSLDVFELETTYQGKKRWLASRVLNYDTMKIPVISFTAGYPLYTQDESKLKGYVIINIRQEVIGQLLKEFLNGELDSIAIINHNGDIVIQEGNKEGLTDFLEKNKDLVMENITGSEEKKVSKIGDNIITFQSIGIQDWKLIKLMSTKEYYDEARAIQRKGLYFSIIVILIGLLISFRFAKALYKPFFLIINKLNKAKLNKKARENEYYYIDRAIDELYDLAINKEDALRKNMNIIKNDFVINLLSAKYVGQKEIDDKLELFGGKESWETNYLLIIKLHQKIYVHSDELTRNLVTYNMIQFFEGYSNPSMRCMPADLFDGKICVVISVQGDGAEHLRTVRKKFVDYMKINFSVDPIILQSDGFEKLMEANGAYNDLLKVLDYVYFMPHTYYIEWKNIKERISCQSSSYQPDFEAFSEALVTRNLTRIKLELKKFIEDASQLAAPAEDMNGYVLKYVFLYNYFLRDIMKENKKEQDKLFKDINDLYNAEDFYFWFIRLIENTFNELEMVENSPTSTVAYLIEKVIMEHLDENLSLEFIAEKVYLSPKYISRVFKEENGINITQFITDCKLKKAAKLLLETNISLEKLIVQVGFSSTNYFIKKFKEKYSITPVQYRRNSID
jgi:two-component system, response regulator YesN